MAWPRICGADGGRREGLAGGHLQLSRDQIEPGHLLGHRVLDLEAGVHLEEEELPGGVHHELHRPGAHVPESSAAVTAAVPSRARRSASTTGEGDSSMIFW